jgi:hypothetical protein
MVKETWAMRLSRSGWWLVVSTAAPLVFTIAGAFYLAHKLADQQAEIIRLGTELRACHEEKAR